MTSRSGLPPWLQLLTKALESELRQEAVEVLESSGSEVTEEAVKALLPETSLPLIHARLINHDTLTPLKNLKANYFGERRWNAPAGILRLIHV